LRGNAARRRSALASRSRLRGRTRRLPARPFERNVTCSRRGFQRNFNARAGIGESFGGKPQPFARSAHFAVNRPQGPNAMIRGILKALLVGWIAKKFLDRRDDRGEPVRRA
jgi:hypothetical protein